MAHVSKNRNHTLKNKIKDINILEIIIILVTLLLIRIPVLFIIATILDTIYFYKLRTKKFKILSGIHGEEEVANLLECELNDNYIIIPDLEIPNGSERTAQIDTIVIGNNVIYMLEIKKFNGKIYGDATSKKLTFEKRINGKISRQERYNPIKQNITHTTAFSNLIYKELGKIYKIIPAIVFVGDYCNICINNSQMELINSKKLIQFIKSNDKGVYISKKDKENIQNILISNNINKLENKKNNYIKYAAIFLLFIANMFNLYSFIKPNIINTFNSNHEFNYNQQIQKQQKVNLLQVITDIKHYNDNYKLQKTIDKNTLTLDKFSFSTGLTGSFPVNERSNPNCYSFQIKNSNYNRLHMNIVTKGKFKQIIGIYDIDTDTLIKTYEINSPNTLIPINVDIGKYKNIKISFGCDINNNVNSDTRFIIGDNYLE